MLKEFKKFALKGNLIDMSIGFVMGAAFTAVVTALTEGVLSPVIGALTAGIDLGDLAVDVAGVSLQYGLFIDALIKFLIVALAMFLIVQGLSRLKPEPEVVPKTKTCPFCQTEIPSKASRCPNCTSQLPA